ncbi:MAG: tRNA dihydrouridine synthase [Phycisphaerales bacterium]
MMDDAPGERVELTLSPSELGVVDDRVRRAVPAFDAPFFQAGLAGYSDAAMRIIARRHGAPYCVTESLLDRLLIQGGKGRAKADLDALAANVPGGEEDHPIAGQIIGTHPDEMAEAAALLAGMGYDTIDVNLACPVRKIARKNRGGHFLAHPIDAREVLHAVREAVPSSIPTTVKLRRGYDDSAESTDRFERIFNSVYELGYSWATVHGRTVEQKYIGPSNWEFLRDLCSRHPDKVIFGSGDIWSALDIFRMIEYTGVKAVSVARGCIGNPWIFRQARQLIAGSKPTEPSIAEQRDTLLAHFELSVAEHGEQLAGRLMRKFGIKFSARHPQGEEVKMRFIRVKSLNDWRAVIEEYYDPGRQFIAVPGTAIDDAENRCGAPTMA